MKERTPIEVLMCLLNEPFAGYGRFKDWQALQNILPSTKKDFVLVACMPKSGSTFFSQTLSAMMGYSVCNIAYAQNGNEQNLYIPNLVRFMNVPTVSQHHTRLTRENLELLRIFSIKPIILVRNIFDTIVSLYDHLIRNVKDDSRPHNLGCGTFLCYVNKHFLELDASRQYDLIIDMSMSWYVHFYVSWYTAREKGRVAPLFVTYEEMLEDKASTFEKAISFVNPTNVQVTRERIQQVLDSSQQNSMRFNKGIVGRGREALSDAQKQRIVQIAKHYEHVDFSPIGIE